MKILLFDIENSPIVTYAWSIHGEPMHSTKFVKKDWYVMCWAAKWLGEKKVLRSALPDDDSYDYKKPDDKKVLKRLWDLLDEADIVVAHNGNKFDRRKANSLIACGAAIEVDAGPVVERAIKEPVAERAVAEPKPVAKKAKKAKKGGK